MVSSHCFAVPFASLPFLTSPHCLGIASPKLSVSTFFASENLGFLTAAYLPNSIFLPIYLNIFLVTHTLQFCEHAMLSLYSCRPPYRSSHLPLGSLMSHLESISWYYFCTTLLSIPCLDASRALDCISPMKGLLTWHGDCCLLVRLSHYMGSCLLLYH